MGLVARVLSFIRVTRNGAKISDVKVNPSGGDNITAEHYADAGDDSHPLPTDYVHTEPQAGTGRASALGYADPINTPKAAAGEKRIYGRDASGVAVNEVWLKADGTVLSENAACSFILEPDGEIRGNNANGFFRLWPDGTFAANGAKMTTDGDVLTSGGISLRDHTHAQANDSDGDTQQETGAPTP